MRTFWSDPPTVLLFSPRCWFSIFTLRTVKFGDEQKPHHQASETPTPGLRNLGVIVLVYLAEVGSFKKR